ncbi:exosortase/archaeosortase family protein [Paludisphaera soli]|uniref:exosortase/archaeosortase family protein n=1 Tax=Paludisphaera soli TaxID=2712865 RepID=UPI0013EBE8A4|nr:exosortase/archaeosortase family protein [Paludisphaera soli]
MQPKRSPLATAPWLLLLLCVFWALWPSLTTMADRWARDPRYAHGYLVPLFSLGLLWSRRSEFADDSLRPSAWGMVPIALGAGLQLVGGFLLVNSVEGGALILYLTGVVLLLAGGKALRRAWPAIAFLAFMIPLPWTIENAMGGPLQAVATRSSTFALQTLGFPAFAEGNVIQLERGRIGVVEACSGLSMLITFVALSTAAAMVVRRPMLDRVILVASSIPVALAANIARITLTGVLHETVGEEAAGHFYHDLAGWLMIPFALALYWLELKLLARILIEVDEAPLLVGLMPASPAPAPAEA